MKANRIIHRWHVNPCGKNRTEKNLVAGMQWLGLTKATQAPLATLVERFKKIDSLGYSSLVKQQESAAIELVKWHKHSTRFIRPNLKFFSLKKAENAFADEFQKIKITKRRDLQTYNNLSITKPPSGHGPTQHLFSSGSTGEPVKITRTGLSHLFFLANMMRDHIWWQRDFTQQNAVVRANASQRITRLSDWGAPVNQFVSSGPSLQLSFPLDLQAMKAELETFKPGYLSVFPSVLKGLIQEGFDVSSIREIRSFGEVLDDSFLKALDSLGVEKTSNLYSSQETGIIALQCPETGLLHEMSEAMIVEILDENDVPCEPGQIGRVVITDLTNYSFPIIRYEIGDLAERGPKCRCGRPHATIKRVMGRTRNLVTYPDGSRRWPILDIFKYEAVAPVRQYQFIQTDLETINFKYLSDRPLSKNEELQFVRIFQAALKHPFNFKFERMELRMAQTSGKFEEFVSQL